MKIKMLESTAGALNGGLSPKLFKKGLVYDAADMEGIDKIFLDIGVAEIHEKPDELARHEKGLTGAPANKRTAPPAPKVERPEEDKYTFEELEDCKASDVRKLALQQNPIIDLSDLAANTSAAKLIAAYLERQ